MSAPVTLQQVLQAYRDGQARSNDELYLQLSKAGALAEHDLQVSAPVGKAGKAYNTTKRAVRWHQQSLKRMGLLHKVDRGVWRICADRKKLEAAPPGLRVAIFGTDLGFAVWSTAATLLPDLGEEVTLCLTSPPFPLARPRDYGNVAEQEYVDWLCRELEPVVKHLRTGGNVVLNLSNDVFERGSPARSLYRERLTLALHERFGLSRMDTIVWRNPCKPPGPVQWASRRRVQLNTAWEPLLWFTNAPQRVIADNRRCLQPHTDQQLQLIERGGEGRGGEGRGAHACSATAPTGCGRAPLVALPRAASLATS